MATGEVKKTLPILSSTLGCDPELFFKKGKFVKGSERIFGTKDKIPTGAGDVAMDGVQVELHPMATGCRANVGNYLKRAFMTLNDLLQKNPDYTLSFDQVVRVTRMELMRLSPKSRELGCMPSFNIYGVKQYVPKPGVLVQTRSAAGHIHISNPQLKHDDATVERLVKTLDLMVGIPGVIMDRNPDAAKRRKTYGKAGEYRLPGPGRLEYRTLSNFWLRSYPLWSLIGGLTKTAVQVGLNKEIADYMVKRRYGYVSTTLDNAFDLLTAGVDFKEVQKAINKNDAELAWKIWNDHVVPFVKAHVDNGYETPTLNKGVVDLLTKFMKRPIEEWFPGDPLQNWLTMGEGHTCGFETFRDREVARWNPPAGEVRIDPITQKAV